MASLITLPQRGISVLRNSRYCSGVLARGSDELVASAVELARKAGRVPATPAQARRLLGIS